MPLPSDYVLLKIHPSIGVARVSTNDDHFVYGDFPSNFKSNDLIKRQAMQFRLFAYAVGNNGREELTPARLTQLGIRARWRAKVANHKTARSRGDAQFIIRAEADSDNNDGKLIGSLAHFQNADSVELGQITSTGLFIPPKAQIFRVSEGAPTGDGDTLFADPDVSDNSCDGSITVELFDEGTGEPINNVPILGSWILVTPPDFAPDTDDDEVTHSGHERTTLEMWLSQKLLLPNLTLTNPVNLTARELDRDIRRKSTGNFAPGIEAAMGRFDSDITRLRSILYPQTVTKNPEEVRFKPKEGAASGAVPGELTASLCSPWQLDFAICTCNYWAAQRPDDAHRDESTDVKVKWLRKNVADVGAVLDELDTTEDFIEHVHKLGILRERNGRVIETERNNDIP